MLSISRCIDFLFPPRDTERMVRRLDRSFLTGTTEALLTGDGTVTALLPYRDPLVHALIVEAKFYGNTAATAHLGALLADYLLEHIAEETSIEKSQVLLIPLPLSAKRRRERGYNQTEKICVEAIRILGEAASLDRTILVRIRDTTPQTRLRKKAREKNIEGAFEARTPDPRHLYIVIDDVVTTGATLGEAVQTLRRAGATRVAGLALAH